MSTAAHTPGPWENIDNMNETGDISILCGKVNAYGNYHVASISRGPVEHLTEEDKANARLIAAAPELLEALESFLRCPSVGSDGPGTSTLRVMDYNLKAARAAIAKATTPEA